ncbi:acyloxyacyl hydrolase [Robertkochia aurantiaca]|uniref:acyloxyacyl hydrolase n=1 Tax=Robertkochia aurantiaca TaxID=2873700 RepID=UPI001CCC5DED|nr:acyloxyacyl hydrolase [Robertkochia sp. 3YJGBD-33]
MQRTCLLILLLSLNAMLTAQEKMPPSFLDVSYFTGNIARHNDDILHLITDHPEGVIVGWNRKTNGEKEWEQLYGYPDYGFSFSYQDLKNEFLGENYALYAHYNFYFFNRNLMMRIGQGLALTTEPYDKAENFRNIAFGTRLMSSTYFMLNYKRERIFDRFGLQAGISLIHYSNANVKAPNTSINSLLLNVGVNYDLDGEVDRYRNDSLSLKYSEPIHLNLAFRTGVNESDVIDSGQYAFYILSAYADKRINRKSGVHLGSEIFFSNFLKEFIRYRAISFPEDEITGDEDYKRVGVFAGHELYINRLSWLAQVGYYLYYPVEFEGRMYLRTGLKFYPGKNWFTSLTLKAHAAKAEAVEIGIGYRL